MRIFYALTLTSLLFLVGCKSPTQVLHATQQEWFGGAPGSGGGVKYVVTLEKGKQESFEVSQVFWGDRKTGEMLGCRLFADSSQASIPVVGSDIRQFRVEFERKFPGRGMGEGNPQPVSTVKAPDDLPADFAKGAVLYYKDKNGKMGQWVVTSFKRLEPLAYP